jgi:tetratricopeptide (TPR) repeat protein
VYLGLAAVSGAAAVAYWLYLEPGTFSSDRGALGSLQQVPALAHETPTAAAPTPAASPAATSSAPAPAPADPAPGSSATEADKTPVSGVQAAAARGTRAAEPSTPPGTPLARAKALIDEGNALSAQGHLGLAESAYQKALGVVPDYPVAMTALVRVHLARRDGNEALRWAKRLVARQDDALAQLLLGDALALRGDLGGAREAWEEAAEGGNATARQRLDD